MIKIRIKEIAKSRGIKNAHRLQLAADLSPAAASRFGKAKLKKSVWKRSTVLCKALECQPGDLFVHTAEKTKKPLISEQPVIEPKSAEIAENGQSRSSAKSRLK